MNEVHAVIELKITPQRESGFGKIAERISRFEQVEACFLMSGAYDLLVFVKGDSLQDVAEFVAQDLSTIEGVLSTATHFMLMTLKPCWTGFVRTWSVMRVWLTCTAISPRRKRPSSCLRRLWRSSALWTR